MFGQLLSIPFRPVVRLAKHLAVAYVGASAPAPCRHMVGIHLGMFVDSFLVWPFGNDAQWALDWCRRHRMTVAGTLFLL